MELKNLLNSEDPPISKQQPAVRIDPENNFPLDAKSQPQIGSKYNNFSQPFSNDFNNTRVLKQSPPSTFQPSTQWPNSNMSAPGTFNQFPPTSQSFKSNYNSGLPDTPNHNQMQDWSRNVQNANGAPTAKPIDYQNVAKQQQQPPKAGEKSPNNNGSSTTASNVIIDERRMVYPRPFCGVGAALKMVERYRSGLVKNELPTKEANTLTNDLPEHPIILTSEVYDTPNNWNTVWKPENIEKIHPEIYVRDLKNAKETKKRVAELRQHAESVSSTGDDELWMARDIPLMHQLSCLSSRKNRNCLGCSNYWKCVSSVQEEIRPWGPNDMLHFEPHHPETFLGCISMNGAYLPLQRDSLACDVFNTLYYSDDQHGVCIWGLIAPADVPKLNEEEVLGAQFFDNKNFVDPTFLEKKVKVTIGIQRHGQTVYIPSGWAFWMVRVGRGLSFSASWNFLRLKHLIEARQLMELNRSLQIYRPINISSLVVTAAYQKLEELETLEGSDRRSSIDFLFNLLPILKLATLEELLEEHVNISSLVVLSYDVVVDRLKKHGRASKISSNLLNEASHIHLKDLSVIEDDAAEDDEDAQFSCCVCKYVLFNTRLSCPFCKGFDLCEQCFNQIGYNHPHKMKKLRRMTLSSLLDLVDNVMNTIYEKEDPNATIPLTQSTPLAPLPAPLSNPMAVVTEREREVTKELVSPTRQQDPRVERNDRTQEREPMQTRESGREKRRRREAKENSPEPRQDNYDQEVIDCICGNNKDLGFMISCERCLAWLHGKCVGISRRNEPEEYYCPRCVKKMGALNAAAKYTPKNFSPERKLREYKLA